MPGQLTPRVSVVMPTYMRADTLPRAAASVRRSTLADWELVVVDDGSPPAVQAAKRAHVDGLTDPRVRFIGLPVNRGHGAARNAGLAAARGEWVAYLDDDDEATPDWLATVVAAADAQVVLGDVVYDGRPPRGVRDVAQVCRRGLFCTVAFAHRRALVATVGGWAEDLPRMADDEVILRYVRTVGSENVCVVPTVAAYAHTWHPRATTAWPSLPAVRRIWADNPWLCWWTGPCTVLVPDDRAAAEVEAGEFTVGEFTDFVTVVCADPARAAARLTGLVATLWAPTAATLPALFAQAAAGVPGPWTAPGGRLLTAGAAGFVQALLAVRAVWR